MRIVWIRKYNEPLQLPLGICLFQKVALDKLSMRVHKMYGKVKEASMLSVRPEVGDPKKGQASLLQKLESKYKHDCVTKRLPSFE